MTALIIILIVLAVLLIPVFFVIGLYNALVKKRNLYRNQFAQIDVQLKRRHDLIPNLVETAKAYMEHERETLEAVIQARNAAESARSNAAANPASGDSVAALASAESGLGGVLGRLFALSENYPELRSNENMLQLQEELTSTESRVAFARQGYNDAVMAFNTYRQSFPPVFFAAKFGHPADAELLEFEDSAQIQAAPSVSF